MASNDKVTGNKLGESGVSLLNDPKFRKYSQAVDKCLTTFDNVHEWADFIAFLTKLLKTFQSFMQFKEIPRKLIVAKRLSQCLNPALPTGVHQRALDVYTHILAVLGPDGLKRDLHIWSSGLFPFFEYAATSVKPTLLNLYDTHYLPLGESLRPVMKALILALLPGLEEETSEFFEKVLSLLDKLSETVSPAFFFQNIWLILITSSSSREASLNYLSRRLPNLANAQDWSQTVGNDLGLMVRALSSALEDEHLLVRRGVLDLLIQSLQLNGTTITHVQRDDQTLLMRAAISVVLRRDLALNRRLYAWLLGPEEKSEEQVTYFKANSLDLLSSTLRDELSSNSRGTSGSRPYRIFVSLLDKWEIGSNLSEVLILDALEAVGPVDSMTTNVDGLLQTDRILAASSLYEAVEPHILWKQLLLSTLSGIEGKSKAALLKVSATLRLIFTTFPNHDDEAQRIYVPLWLSCTIETIHAVVQRGLEPDSSDSIIPLFDLLLASLLIIPTSALLHWTDVPGVQACTPRHRAVQLYEVVFESDQDSTLSTPRTDMTPITSSFESLASISMLCAHRLAASQEGTEVSYELLYHTINLLIDLVSRLAESSQSVRIEWRPIDWLEALLGCLSPQSPFELVDRTIELGFKIHELSSIKPALQLTQRLILDRLFNLLFRFLEPHHAPYHGRAVHWIWQLEHHSQPHHLEGIIAKNLTQRDLQQAHHAYDAFGVLWRLTDDSSLPGTRLKVPLGIVLDTLKSDNPSLRRIGETWMRSSLRSYLRILDPMLTDLLSAPIARTPTSLSFQGRSVRTLSYERPFDQHQVHYVLENLLSVVRFGGQGFSKVTQSTPINRSHDSGLPSLVERAQLGRPSSNYMDILIEVLLGFLQSEPKPSLASKMSVTNVQIHGTAIDLIQTIVGRGEVDTATLEGIESVIIARLFIAVHTQRLDLQNKLLHILHSVTFALASTPPPDIRGSGASDHGSDHDEKSHRASTPNPLLVQTLIDGLSLPSNRPVLQHWIDFILMTISQFRSLSHVILPLCDCLCRQLGASLLEIQHLVQRSIKGKSTVASYTTDAEFIMLLNALERLVLMSLSKGTSHEVEDDNTLGDRGPNEPSTGLFGYVFGTESTNDLRDPQLLSRSPAYRCLHEGVSVLHSIWTSLSPGGLQTSSSPLNDYLGTTMLKTKNRCQKVLERFYRIYSAEVIESLIVCSLKRDLSPSSSDANAILLIDTLTPSAQSVMQMLSDSISFRIFPALERNRKGYLNPNLSDVDCFGFLEQYISRLEGPIAVQVWGRFIPLVKEVLANLYNYKLQIYPLTRCMTVLAEKVVQTSALEDKKVKKELQDAYTRLIDACILIAGRAFDQGTWIRRSTVQGIPSSGRASPALGHDPTDGLGDDKAAPFEPARGTGTDLVNQINTYLATGCLPNLRRFLVDNDKILNVCSNIIYYIVNPAMKIRASKTLETDDVILEILAQMTKLPQSIKAWRPVVLEAFNDTRFFNCTPSVSHRWQPLVRGLMDADRQSLMDLLNKLSAAPSANIFMNKETEMLLKSLNMRRLSYALLAGDKNQFLTQLPVIQEKLVDILRMGAVTPTVHSEVYLCMRVLLCRIAPRNLSSFWPVILTELFRVFDQIFHAPPTDGSDELLLVLSACKFLDLLVVLQTEEFQVHEWMFITDTVDAVYRPDHWKPESLMDRLAEVISDIPDSKKPPTDDTFISQSISYLASLDSANPSTARDPTFPSSSDLYLLTKRLRRPLLNPVRKINSLKDLLPFFSHVSMYSYESTYAGGMVDWEAVEKGLVDDLFDGEEARRL